MPYPYFLMSLPMIPPTPSASEASHKEGEPLTKPLTKPAPQAALDGPSDEKTLCTLTTPSWVLDKKLSLAEWLLTGGLVSLGLAFWNGVLSLTLWLTQNPESAAWQTFQTFLLTTFLASLLVGFGLSLVATLCIFSSKKQ